MFQINKTSHLVTVSSDIVLAELKKKLTEQGLYLGYYPLDELHFTLNYYLSRRTVNLYHFKFGSISDLVSSALIELNQGQSFHLKDAPRSAIGPDFNRIIIGSKEELAQIKTVTLRLVALPEHITHALVVVKTKEQAQQIISYMAGQFMLPQYFCYFDNSLSHSLKSELKIKENQFNCLLIRISGLKELVDAQAHILEKHLSAMELNLLWFDKKNMIEIIHRYIYNLETFKLIKEQYRHFLWPASDGAMQHHWEEEYLSSVK